MRITAEQATRVARYLQEKGSDVASTPVGGHTSASDDLMVRILASISTLPEVRADRVCAGRALLDARLPSSEELAERILWRVIADHMR